MTHFQTQKPSFKERSFWLSLRPNFWRMPIFWVWQICRMYKKVSFQEDTDLPKPAKLSKRLLSKPFSMQTRAALILHLFHEGLANQKTAQDKQRWRDLWQKAWRECGFTHGPSCTIFKRQLQGFRRKTMKTDAATTRGIKNPPFDMDGFHSAMAHSWRFEFTYFSHYIMRYAHLRTRQRLFGAGLLLLLWSPIYALIPFGFLSLYLTLDLRLFITKIKLARCYHVPWNRLPKCIAIDPDWNILGNAFFGSHVDSANTYAYYNAQLQTVVLSACMHFQSQKLYEHILLHEFLHHLRAYNNHALYKLPSSLEEALTESFTCLLDKHEFANIYKTERQMLKALFIETGLEDKQSMLVRHMLTETWGEGEMHPLYPISEITHLNLHKLKLLWEWGDEHKENTPQFLGRWQEKIRYLIQEDCVPETYANLPLLMRS